MPRKIIPPGYLSWRSMRQRCLNPLATGYANYGGRGIKICEQWNTFEGFIADMGTRPEGMTLERINNNGNYERDNCKWAGWKEQRRNTRFNRLVTFQGKTQPMAAWSEQTGLAWDTIYTRLRAGWTIEKALTSPLQRLIKA